MASNNTLIMGIGNTLCSDDGTGIHMLAYMQRHYPSLEKVEYIDGGIPSFKLAAWIETAGKLIVIDAAELDSAPGTVEVFSGEEMDHFAGKTRRREHEVSLGDLLAMAHRTDALPENRALVVIQPENIDRGLCLSNRVKQALPLAGRSINDLFRKWHARDAAVATVLLAPGSHTQQPPAMRGRGAS